MKDRLEDYLVKNRHQFDVYDEPGDLLWQRIDRELRPRRSLMHVVSKWAAAVIILVGAGYLGISEGIAVFSDESTTTLVQADAGSFDPFAAEITQIESYYTSVINNHKDQLQAFREEGIELDPEDTANLEHLQQMYQDLQKELAY